MFDNDYIFFYIVCVGGGGDCCTNCKILSLTNMIIFSIQTRHSSQYYKETNVIVNRTYLMRTNPLI
jgi:hypothetical protein